jgi:hypothetical protein
MKTTLLLLAAAGAALLVAALPAGAITNGEVDGDAHAFVGLMVGYDATGRPLGRCTGTLLSPTVFVTAGHCTNGVDHAQIWFDSGYPTPIPLAQGFEGSCAGFTGYPCTGGVAGSSLYTHPDFQASSFQLHDVGVVVLDSPVTLNHYGQLPDPYALEGLEHGAHTTFTAVGYGLQQAFPPAAAAKDVGIRTRMVAHPKLIQIDNPSIGDHSLIVSANGQTGGTCIGDSGGPYFLDGTNVVAAVDSFGKNGNCAGQSGAFRLDLPSARDFVEKFLPPNR